MTLDPHDLGLHIATSIIEEESGPDALKIFNEAVEFARGFITTYLEQEDREQTVAARLIDLADGDVFTTANESDVPYGAKVKYVSPGVNEQVTVVDANDHELLTDHMHRTVYVVRSA
jgi:hypothetical protein